MAALKHLLVPTDGSEGALKAATAAGDLARALEAKVSVLFVQSEDLIMPHAWGIAGDHLAGTPYDAMSIDEIRVMIEQQVGEKELPETVAALGALEEEPQSVMVWGHPTEEICRYASDHEVDLIVIGSHGRSGLKRALLGSISHAVANHAPCPVTIVR